MKTIKITIVLILMMVVSVNINAQDKEVFKKSMKIEGRIMYDFNFLSDGDDYSYGGNEFRRLRIAAKGKIAKNIGYKAEFDFAGGKVNFRDVYLKFALPSKAGNVMLGSFTEPSSLNNMTSSKYITFFERSMMADTQNFKYNAGVMYDNQKLLDGRMGLQLAYTFNGDKGIAFTDKSIQNGANIIARVTGTVLNNKEDRQVIHLGINYEHRDDDIETYTYKFRTENHMGDKQTVKNIVGVFENTNDIGFETAATFGSLSVQGEYEAGSINTDDKNYTTRGYYGFVSYFLTGEHRPYKNSSFGRVKPKSEFCIKDRTWGAVELVARYSVMDMNGTFDVDNTSNEDYKIANITTGINWYLNKNTRIMYNFVYGDFNDLDTYGTDGEKLSGHLIRFQIDF